ncbi:hypothetical protein PR202_gb27385 [Eleusine coracana subsp. coracana]|uniref:DUF4220 domain-containing protein n=1 Tax=Eleusine coracana subsp. coracana TaxID=191504 RepID=A0AAV5FTQ8_ELECO|nr:hypothetical protein PR202_gb27385 [Eleusine coracana subsp. coracana]
MAGDAWVMDIIWHTSIIMGKWVINFWREWSMELLLGASFVVQLMLSLFAGYRWRGASEALRRFIWLFYIGADYVATTALGNLSISDSSSERQLVTFWAPFFLLHLGGPDNITAYEFEDNQLSMRSVLQLVVQILGTVIIVYFSITESWDLILAAWLILFVCVTKYIEKTLALQCANLENIRRSLKRKDHHDGRRRNLMCAADDDNDTTLLMKAHSLFHICKHALVDSLVEEELNKDEADQTRRELFDLEWSQQLEVMEMELSLMYEFLYTKASVIYTWHGYSIRALSPLAVLGSLVLVEFSNQGGRHKQSDVAITRVLLAATFILETVSLLRALGSSWTGFLTCTRLRPAWIHHRFFCNRQWHRLRHVLASLGLIANMKDKHNEEHQVNNHRRWAGYIGQLNLFHCCVTCGPQEQESFWVGSKEKIKPDAKKVLYTKVQHKVVDFRDELKLLKLIKMETDEVMLAAQLSTNRGQKTLKSYYRLNELKRSLGNKFPPSLGDELRFSLGNELQVAILTWHIGTDIFLNISDKAKASDQVASSDGRDREAQQVKAIRTLSNYMMYLMCERPHMLPGLVTRQLLEQTRKDLVKVLNGHDAMKESKTASKHEHLARILYSKGFDREQVNTYLGDGIRLGKKLIKIDKGKEKFLKVKDSEKRKGVVSDGTGGANKKEKEIVRVILDVWVDMLFYASYRCNKESHAKQLAYGGELTTIVWLLAQHAGLFVVPKHRKKPKKPGEESCLAHETSLVVTDCRCGASQMPKLAVDSRETSNPTARTTSDGGEGLASRLELGAPRAIPALPQRRRTQAILCVSVAPLPHIAASVVGGSPPLPVGGGGVGRCGGADISRAGKFIILFYFFELGSDG